MNFFFRIASFIKRKFEKYQIIKLKQSFAECGHNVRIHPTCTILVPGKMKIGANSSIGAYTSIFAGFDIVIGKDCLISTNCGISSVNHVQDSLIRYRDDPPEVTGSKAVIIGNNVWIGMNACVLPGVTIGDNSIIGAGSVVTKNIPENEVWVGCPARFVKKLHIVT